MAHNLRLELGENDEKRRTVSAYGYEIIKLPPKCPYSSILTNDAPDNIMQQYTDSGVTPKILQLQYKTHLLFNKYVKSGSAEHEINISYQLRKRLTRDFGDMTTLVQNRNYRDLASFEGIWSKCLEEQWKYLSNSTQRFKKTQSFQRIVQHFSK